MRKRKRRNRKRRLKFRQKVRGRRRIPHEVKEFVLSRDNHQCQHCGTDRNLTMHHIRYRRNGGESVAPNLLTLCEYCHRDYHRQMG